MRPYLAVAVGGALGALARWGVQLGLPARPGGWPWATVTVNLTGCLAIGVLLAVLLARFPRHPWLRPFLATGVLGGYTTFSAFTVDAVRLVDAGRPAVAGVYVLVSVLGGLGAVVLGLAVGRSAVGGAHTGRAALDAGEDRP